MTDYIALPKEDTWIAYLRTRLPYSFGRIDAKRVKGVRTYILSQPITQSHRWAGYHNFWLRGHVYYAVAKLIDVQHLPLYFKDFRISHTDELRSKFAGQIERLGKFPIDVWNALQFEKLWDVVVDDVLDRERVVMTNMTQGIELCLKAVKTHAQHRETGVFSFNDGHNLKAIYDSLPEALQQEILAGSVVFARDYEKYRRSADATVSKLRIGHGLNVHVWKKIADVINQTSYTALMNANDPWCAGNIGCQPEDWFESAIEGIGDITDHRYSPRQDKDEYPPVRIHRGLMLGRFMYEHLFPLRRPAGG